MYDLCHRCHAELPSVLNGGHQEDSVALFCPSCGAPQLRLQEHMRVEAVAAAPLDTTGATPPPAIPGAALDRIDWRIAITLSTVVAAIGAVLSVAGMKFPAFSLLAVVWAISCATITLSLYMGRRPAHRIDGGTGARIGLLAGTVMVALLGLATATSGLILRFGTNQMVEVDRQTAEQRKAMQANVVAFLGKQSQDKDLTANYIAQMNSPQMNSPELLASSALIGGAFQALVIVLFSVGGGALTGSMRGAQMRRMGQGGNS